MNMVMQNFVEKLASEFWRGNEHVIRKCGKEQARADRWLTIAENSQRTREC